MRFFYNLLPAGWKIFLQSLFTCKYSMSKVILPVDIFLKNNFTVLSSLSLSSISEHSSLLSLSFFTNFSLRIKSFGESSSSFAMFSLTFFRFQTFLCPRKGVLHMRFHTWLLHKCFLAIITGDTCTSL